MVCKRLTPLVSMPYGTQNQEPNSPASGVGLLFMCYQRDIAEQFEFLQTRWANNVNFLHEATSLDPIIGQTNEGTPVSQQWPTGGGTVPAERKSFDWHGMVTLQGGEYFFAPDYQLPALNLSQLSLSR